MKIKFRKYWRKTSLKQKDVGDLFLNHVFQKKPKNFLEIGIFHGVTSRNICELLRSMHGNDFKFTGIDLFSYELTSKSEYIPETSFSNPLKTIYHKYIVRLDPYSLESVNRLLKKFKSNVTVIKGDSNEILKEFSIDKVDYVFLDGGHQYETVKNDLKFLTKVVNNNGTILCDDYDLIESPGVKQAIDEYVADKKFNLKIIQTQGRPRFAEIRKNDS